MNEQTGFISRIGKWFRGDANGEMPLGPDSSTAIAPRGTLFRPWARRDQAINNLQDGFNALTDLMQSIRDNLEKQGHRQDELLQHLSHLPAALETLPESSRVQSETLRAIHQQIQAQGGQQQKLAEILERISEADREQRDTVEALCGRMEALQQQDERIANNLNNVGIAMQTVGRSSEASTAVLGQMRDNLNARDGELERILNKQGTRFTTMLAIAIFLSIAALAAVSVIGYLGYQVLNRVQ